MRDHLPPGSPRRRADPFADDPNDPSAALDDGAGSAAGSTGTRAAVEADLADLAIYAVGPPGIRGLVVCCDDCQQGPLPRLGMLRANLLQRWLMGRPHEPAYDPEPGRLRHVDYCRG